MADVTISANFAFPAQEFPHVAEGSIHGDPRASCIHARQASATEEHKLKLPAAQPSWHVLRGSRKS